MREVEGENHQLPDDQEAQKQQGRRGVIPERGCDSAGRLSVPRIDRGPLVLLGGIRASALRPSGNASRRSDVLRTVRSRLFNHRGGAFGLQQKSRLP